jgi:hypothetical protein
MADKRKICRICNDWSNNDTNVCAECKKITDAEARLKIFIKEQKKHWAKLLKGKIPSPEIIKGWIECCDFAGEDVKKVMSFFK